VLPAELIKMDNRVNMQPDNHYSVDAIVTEEGLDGLEEAWNRLSASSDSPNVFTTYGWYRAWLRRLVVDEGAKRLQPYVLAIKQDGAIVGISPLVRRVVSRFGFRVRKLEFLTHHADYNDLIVGKDQAAQASVVVKFLAREANQWDFIDLRDMQGSEIDTGHLENSLVRAGLRHKQFPEEEGCPYLLLGRSVADVTKELSAHERSTLRRRTELATEADLRTRIIENPEQEPGLLDKLIAVDRMKHLHRLTPSFVGVYPEVFRALMENLGPRGWLYVGLLEAGDQSVAFQFGFRCGQKLWDYAKAYDRSFRRFAPGTLLLTAVLEYGIERGFKEYDFLRGEDPYKAVWGTGSHRRVRFLIWNRNWMSRLGAFAYFNLHLGRR
jgi:CelD/BcsL family acetyltransferase involved in cellulose biosynthesis